MGVSRPAKSPQQADYPAALYWLEQAAKQGNTSAQDLTGVLYQASNLKEKGIKQNIAVAFYWYVSAANSTADGNDSAACHAFRSLKRANDYGQWNGNPQGLTVAPFCPAELEAVTLS